MTIDDILNFRIASDTWNHICTYLFMCILCIYLCVNIYIYINILCVYIYTHLRDFAIYVYIYIYLSNVSSEVDLSKSYHCLSALSCVHHSIEVTITTV